MNPSRVIQYAKLFDKNLSVYTYRELARDSLFLSLSFNSDHAD